MNEQNVGVIKELLELQPYFNVATSDREHPWNTPVWAARGTNNFRCLYLDCSVEDASEAALGIALLYPGETVRAEDFLGDGLKRIYKAQPRRAWLNCLSERDLTPQTVKMRQEISLKDLLAAAL